MKKHFAAMAAAMTFVMAPTAANAQAAAVVSAISSLGSSISSMIMNTFANGTMVPLVTNATGQVQGEISKMSNAQIQSQAAIAQYETQSRLQEAAANINEESRQPYNTCGFIENSKNLKNAESTANKRMMNESGNLSKLGANPPDGNAMLKSLKSQSLTKYATKDDAKRYGVAESKLPGADFDSSYLFGSKSGSATYDEGQFDAVKTMVVRKTAMDAPQSLPSVAMEEKPSGMLYRQLQLKYASFTSNAQAALLSIASNRTPDANGNSVMGTIHKLVHEKFSPENIKTNAGSLKSGPILRDIAMMDSARLWIDYQALRNQEHMIALLADQQIILAEEIIGRKLKTLYPEASR